VIYRFHPEAMAEHFDAVSFYRSRAAGLGEGYLAEFEALMVRVVQSPKAFRIQLKPDIRRAHLERFPFTVIYREAGSAVQVLAVMHKRRRPNYWVERL
jgi:toxin ParE1/3/4